MGGEEEEEYEDEDNYSNVVQVGKKWVPVLVFFSTSGLYLATFPLLPV